MEKVYFSVMILAITALIYPILQTAVNDANLSNVMLDTFLVNFPVVLLVILTIIPVYFFIGEKRK